MNKHLDELRRFIAYLEFVGIKRIVIASVVLAIVFELSPWFLLLLIPVAVAWAAVLANRRRQRERDAALAIELARDLDYLLLLSPASFEAVVGAVLAGVGFRDVEHVGQTRDRGVDLRAIDRGGQLVIVQCKRYALHRTVGGPEVRSLLGALLQARAAHGFLITTAQFTREAHTAAAGQPITLVDGLTLTRWAQEAQRG